MKTLFELVRNWLIMVLEWKQTSEVSTSWLVKVDIQNLGRTGQQCQSYVHIKSELCIFPLHWFQESVENGFLDP
jgi:hypothetical protein